MSNEGNSDDKSKYLLILEQLDLDAVAEKAGGKESYDFGRAFLEKARGTSEVGDEVTARAWTLVGQVCQMMFAPSDVNEPFSAFAVFQDGRTLIPDDIDEETLKRLIGLAPTIRTPEVKSRIADVAWCRLRDIQAAHCAIDGYVKSADALFDPEHWVEYAERIERALRLAVQIRDNNWIANIEGQIIRRLDELNGSDPLYLSLRLVELQNEFEFGDPEVASTYLQRIVDASHIAGDFEKARKHLSELSVTKKRAGDKEAEKIANFRIAQSYEEEGEHRAKGGSNLAAAHFFEFAHDAYRSIPGCRQDAERVYSKLREAQAASVKEMQSVTTPSIDVSEIITAARDHVSEKSTLDAMLSLATLLRPSDFQKLNKRAIEHAKKCPLQSLFGGRRMDHDGRVTGIRTAATDEDHNQTRAQWERVVELAMLDHQFEVQSTIIPALQQINFEHSISLRDIRDIVANNPIVPKGHEELITKGLCFGFRLQFQEANSILVPQFENCIRHVLKELGCETSTRDRFGIQDHMPFGTLLGKYQDQLRAVMSVNVILELKLLFTDQNGAAVRNRVAHGLAPSGEFFAPHMIYAWWFMYFVIVNPIFRYLSNAPVRVENDATEEHLTTRSKK